MTFLSHIGLRKDVLFRFERLSYSKCSWRATCNDHDQWRRFINLICGPPNLWFTIVVDRNHSCGRSPWYQVSGAHWMNGSDSLSYLIIQVHITNLGAPVDYLFLSSCSLKWTLSTVNPLALSYHYNRKSSFYFMI